MSVAVFIFLFLLSYETKADFPFQNVSLSWNDRVDDIVNRLTVDEMMYQMAKGGGWPNGGPAPAISRLGIGPYQWDTECLSGDVMAGNATSFPIAIGLAAAFSSDLIFRVAEATSIEVRAKHNDYIKRGIYDARTGLSCFSPVINIMRHPLWGRNQETYGEDPYLSGIYATAFVKGLQGNHSRYVRANAGCKHFDAHGGPENIEGNRESFDSVVSDRDWRLTFLPAFKRCVDAGTYSLMCSYNSINGIPSCCNSKLLTTILRDEWNFTGYVVSDGGAIENILIHHFYYLTADETVAGSVNAGCNLELDGGWPKPIYLYMSEAVSKSLLLESTVRERVKPLFYTRMRLGEFDPPSMNPYTQLNLSVIESDKHKQLSVEAATKSFVLLKTQDGFLPFSERIPKIAVLGPMANNSKQLFGDYSADTDPKFVTTPLDGLIKIAKDTAYLPGCNDGNKCNAYSPTDVMNTVQNASVIFVCLGIGTDFEAEGKDRYNMELPGKQLTLLQDAVKYGNGAPVILLLFSAGPVNITWADSSPAVRVIIQCFYPAQSTGEAIFTVLTGSNNLNPAGRLPYTWYKNADQIPSMVKYTMTERTYRYFTGEPLYPFGYGLSYTTFQYSNLLVPNTVKAGESIPVQVSVANTGKIDSDEVVQVYISWVTTRELMPNIQLVGFDRIFIPHNSGPKDVTFNIEPRDLAVWTDNQGFIIEQGSIMVYVGGQQPNQKKAVNSNVLSAVVNISGSKHIK